MEFDMPQQKATPAFSRAEMDRVAKSRGYRDYNHMIYVMRNGLPRPRQDNATWATQGTSGSGGIGNWLHTLWNDPHAALAQAFAWHPMNTIGMASDAMANANAQMNGNQ